MIHCHESFLLPFFIAVPGLNGIIIIRYVGQSE